MKSSEALNVFANLINSNRGTGITVLQSSQLTRLANNCILNNGCGGVTVEKECRVELRGNGIYKNGSHGISFNGSGQIVENDVVGNRGCGIQISNSTDIKVRTHFIRVHMQFFVIDCWPFHVSSFLLLGFAQSCSTSTRLWHGRAGPGERGHP